jgi:rhodanese-related sulfurtransferase
MTLTISTEDIRRALIERTEIALLDLRDEAAFAEAHPLFAASMPLGRLATDVPLHIPRAATTIALYDDSDGLVDRATATLTALGYSDVRALAGGLSGWRDAGGELFRDVNVPSKAFGELVESVRHTPSIAAEDLSALVHQGADVVVLDARRFSEFETMSIPYGISVPGGELVYRVREIAPSAETFVVVNCAGRTRSIIGAQSLVNAGIPNRVAALRNGTIGWTLAGLTLEHGQRHHFPPVTSQGTAWARAAARGVADRAGVQRVDRPQLASLASDDGRTLYRFDVRTPEEFAAGHRRGFVLAPGGQLVQETDVFAPVRGARIALTDSDGVRANMTASWLAQMGWSVFVLEEGQDPGELTIDSSGTTGAEPTPPARAKTYKRPYEGTDTPRSTMQAYLDWEAGLVAQLGRDGTHGFRVI